MSLLLCYIGFLKKKTFNGTEIQLAFPCTASESELKKRGRSLRNGKGAIKATTVISEKPATTRVFQTSY